MNKKKGHRLTLLSDDLYAIVIVDEKNKPIATIYKNSIDLEDGYRARPVQNYQGEEFAKRLVDTYLKNGFRN